MAGILIITTLMHNVKAEAVTGDNNKAKIKAVSGDKDENQKIKEIMLKSEDSYLAHGSAFANVLIVKYITK